MKLFLLDDIIKNDSFTIEKDNRLKMNKFTEFSPYFIFLFLLLFIIIILVLLILRNCLKKNNNIFNVSSSTNKIYGPKESKSSYTQILKNILSSSTKNSNSLDKINNGKLREYFNERMKKEGGKAVQDKIFAVLNTPLHSSSQTVDSETHNILCTSVSVIPVIYIKNEGDIIK
jgi:hypothetical protein